MNWIDEELDREQEAQHASQSPPSEQEIAEAVRSWWRWFGDALKGNCVEAREHAIPASFSEPAPERYRVANSEAGLAVDFALDEQIRSVHFDYSSSNSNTPVPEAAPTSLPAISTAPPEGGVLTLRPARTPSGCAISLRSTPVRRGTDADVAEAGPVCQPAVVIVKRLHRKLTSVSYSRNTHQL